MAAAPRCPICKSADTRALARWRLGYTICECGACNVLFSDPLPTDDQLSAFYQGFLYNKPDVRRLGASIARRKDELSGLLRTRHGAGLRLLDHGGGTGVSYAAAKQLGFETYFNDLDQHAIELVRELHGLDDAHCIADLGATGQRFDFIVSDNVIEHLPDPIANTRVLIRLLAPGGTLIIKTPWGKANEQLFYPLTVLEYARRAAEHDGYGSALRSLRAPIWCCDPPRHLYGFTPESLTMVATEAGVPASWCEIDAYHDDLLNKSLLATYTKRPAGLLGIAKRAAVLPLLGPELAMKALHLSLRAAKLLTPMGLILRVQRKA